MYVLDDDPLKVLTDEGYHTAEELDKCEEIGLDTLVGPKEQPKHNSKSYTAEKFRKMKWRITTLVRRAKS